VLDACKGGLLVSDNISLIQVDGSQALTELPETPERSEEIDLQASSDAVSTITEGFIAVIESRIFIRECIRRSSNRRFPFKFKPFQTQLNCNRKTVICQV
jgi:hypothetical protein